MEGRGVTNYSVDKPSYAFSGATTDFDDALIQHGVVTKEQALAAKGMSAEDARRLAANPATLPVQRKLPDSADADADAAAAGDGEENDSLPDDDEDEDDEFFTQYRAQRLAELEQESNQKSSAQEHRYGEPVWIDRTEWTRHVNDDSHHVWVVVCLASSDTERTGRVQEAVQALAALHTRTKFVLIAADSAIARWPVENLPSLFLYRHGTMQHEMVRLPVDMTAEQLCDELNQRSVL